MIQNRLIRRVMPLILGIAAGWLALADADAQTGTFVDRWNDGDLRVVSYNIFFDSIFDPSPSVDQEIPDRFTRVVNALDPDVLALQEIFDHSASEVVALMNSVAPLPGGATWHAHRHSDNVTVSKYPFQFTTNSAGHADALIDLPDGQFSKDFFVLNDHLPCCSNEQGRQNEADAIVGWLEDARAPGGQITLPDETPFVVLGDFNIVGSGQPLQTLITGQTANDSIATDSPPDWDGTPLTDARPPHNGAGPDDYTWRNDSSQFAPGVLDYILFTDSELATANRFVLNPTTMSPADLAATGLQANDVLIDVADGFFDHLPLVVDFRLRADTLPGDYSGDGVVDAADHAVFAQEYAGFATSVADGNGDGVVNAVDYAVYREAAAASAAAVPEPLTLLQFCVGAVLTVAPRRR